MYSSSKKSRKRKQRNKKSRKKRRKNARKREDIARSKMWASTFKDALLSYKSSPTVEEIVEVLLDTERELEYMSMNFIWDGKFHVLLQKSSGKRYCELSTDGTESPMHRQVIVQAVMVDPARKRQGIATSFFQQLVQVCTAKKWCVQAQSIVSTEGKALAKALKWRELPYSCGTSFVKCCQK